MASGCRTTRSPSKSLLCASDLDTKMTDADVGSNRTDVILTEPQGKSLMEKAWAEALEDAKKVDANFIETMI